MLYNHLRKTLLICLLLFVNAATGQAQSEHLVQLGADILPGDDNTSARFQLTINDRITPRFSAGLGTGFTYYNDPLSLLPFFMDLNYALSGKQPALFGFLRAGYNVSILTDTDVRVDDHRGGLMLNPGLGLKFSSKDGVGWHLSVGYSIDKSEFEFQRGTSRTVTTDITYKRLMMGFGLSF